MLPIGTTKLRVTMRAGLRELDALTETPGFKPLEDYPASAAYLGDRHLEIEFAVPRSRLPFDMADDKR